MTTLLTATWETLHDLATGLGWLGIGVLSYFLLVGVTTWAWSRFWDGVHASEGQDFQAELRAWEANEDFEDALRCTGRVPHDRHYEKAGRSA